jgi:hypothetical protein
MRQLFGVLAILLGAISVLVCGRYGYQLADNPLDGAISGVFFGAIALCAFAFDVAAIRLWFAGHKTSSTVLAIVTAAALIVTVTNSLGAIASRDDARQAERSNAKADKAADRAELARLAAERAAMRFTPATDATVKAAEDAVGAAEAIRQRECGNGDPRQRGPNCRLRESEEQAKRDALVRTMADRDATKRAAALDAQAAAVRVRLAKGENIVSTNPLADALSAIIPGSGAVVTSWQRAIVALVFEACLLALMATYELLGHPARTEPAKARDQDTKDEPEGQAKPAATPLRAIAPPRLVSSKPARSKAKAGSNVERFLAEEVVKRDGARLEFKKLLLAYRAWCSEVGETDLAVVPFGTEVGKLVTVDPPDADRRVFCVGVALRRLKEAQGAPSEAATGGQAVG